MAKWVETHKPSASASAHLMLAWFMWAVVGASLAAVGTTWMWQTAPKIAPWLAVGALMVGVLKSRAVLDRAAGRIADRIRVRGDGRCLGGFLSLQSWTLVVVMVVAGRLLRTTVARGIVSPLYLAVGTALLVSSRLLWHAWREAG
jgi:hypothetical protein